MNNSRLTQKEIIWTSLIAGWIVLNLFLLLHGGKASTWEPLWKSDFRTKVNRSPHELFYPFETSSLAFYDLDEFLAFILTPITIFVVFFFLSRLVLRRNN